jgi:hypothetical protein
MPVATPYLDGLLDNTIWGGVIGDDGLEGIVIGQGARLAKRISHSRLMRAIWREEV